MTTCYHSIHNDAGNAARSRIRLLGHRLRQTLLSWSERSRHRRELQEVLEMPEHLLRDMGLTREDVYRQYRKPFWRQ